ncbi:hypothetical protein CMK14_03520 [Candidatus Poribacteria bacterium]|nr:hypothetical protein [Candidatus Poribacteria bacterium]
MPRMNITELFQDQVVFPYGVIRRVSAAAVGTFFLTKVASVEDKANHQMPLCLDPLGFNPWPYSGVCAMKTISRILLFGLFSLIGCGQPEPPKAVQESTDQLPVAEFRTKSRQRTGKSTVDHVIQVLDDLYAEPAEEVEQSIDPQTVSTPLVSELAESESNSPDQSQTSDISNEEVEDMLAFLANSEIESLAEAEESLAANWWENPNIESALVVLSQAVLSDDRDVRMDAVLSLSQMGEEAVPALSQALTDDDRDIRLNAVQSLELIGDEAAPALFQALLDDDRDIRFDTVTALGRLGQQGALVLSQAPTDDDRDIRLHAVNSLGQMGSQAVPVLSQALLDDDRDIRLQTVTSLTQMGAVAAPSLLQALDDDDQEISTLATSALEMMSR